MGLDIAMNVEFAYWPIVISGVASLAMALVLVISRRWHGRFTMDGLQGIQKVHIEPTPRVGGIAIFFGVAVGFLLARNEPQSLLGPLLLASLPAFVFGLAEDLTKRVSVGFRFLATMSCGVLGWALTGYAITDVNIPGVNWLLGFTLIAVAFTAFSAAGVANAINIVDGFNGLAAGTSSIILITLGMMAASLGDVALARACMYIALPVLGFTFVNWPMGKIFLGDGGAYFVGFAIAWLSVLLLARHPEVSAFAPLLVCIYPVMEVVFSIWRRKRRHLHPGQADRLHLHSLVKRRITPKIVPHASALMRNSVTGALMWVPAAIPAVLAFWFKADTGLLFGCMTVFCAAYVYFYKRISSFRGFGFRRLPRYVLKKAD